MLRGNCCCITGWRSRRGGGRTLKSTNLMRIYLCILCIKCIKSRNVKRAGQMEVEMEMEVALPVVIKIIRISGVMGCWLKGSGGEWRAEVEESQEKRKLRRQSLQNGLLLYRFVCGS